MIPVLVVPFREDESIDEVSLCREVEFAIQAKAAAICAPGFASEFYKLTDAERRHVIKVISECTQGRIPVFASTGCGSVRATIELSQYAEQVGADALMVSTPGHVPLGAREYSVFLEAVCRNVTIPVMLQDSDVTGVGLPASEIVAIGSRCNNLKFAKLESPLSGKKCSDIVKLSDNSIQVFYGMQGVALIDGLAHGATGVMPGPAFVELYSRVVALYKEGQRSRARTMFCRMQPYITFAVQHLELLIKMEKRSLLRYSIFFSDRMRQPTLHLDEIYYREIDELIDLMLSVRDQMEYS